MFVARGALQRRLANAKRDRDDKEQRAAASSQRSGSRQDENGTNAPMGGDPEAQGQGRQQGGRASVRGETIDSKPGGRPEEQPPQGENEQEDPDTVKLIPLAGLKGKTRAYVKCSNFARRILGNTWFNSTVMLCISWASLSVGLQTYEALAASSVLDNLDLVVLSVFIIECVFKILAEGLTPWVFFTGPEMKWNNFDFIIIIMSLPMWGSALGGGNIAILRMLRLLRIMKLVKRIPQLYMIVMGLIGGLKSIGYILLLLFLVFYLYAISGMYAWGDNDQFHFRSVPVAMVTLFRMSTLENWANIMNVNYFGCDRFRGGYYSDDPSKQESFQYCNTTKLYGENATQADIDSTRMVNNFVATLYFITFILISAFVMLSLFIGAITMSMTQSMEHMKEVEQDAERKERLEKARKRTAEAERREREKQKKLAEEGGSHGDGLAKGATSGDAKEKLSGTQKRERQKMREVLLQTWDDCDLTDILVTNQGNTHSLKGKYLFLASKCTKLAEHPRFTGFVTMVICMAGMMVGLQTSMEIVDSIGGFLNVVDSMILAVFTTECVIKIIAEGLEPWMFLKSAWNTFDLIIVLGSFMGGKGGMLTMLRLLRLLRVLKLVKAFPQLQVIVSALMKGVGSIGYIGLILLLCFYVFGIIGNMLFAANDPFHFKYLHYAMISLFHCATMDGWSDVLYINFYGCDHYGYDDYKVLGYNCTNHASGFLAVAYFGCFTVLGGMVLITLFIGVVTTSMEEATQEMEDEKRLIQRVEDVRVRKGVEQSTINSYMQVFRMLDLDNSGSVEEAELRIGLAAIGKYPSYEELKEMMDVVDEDGSGQIDVVEFVEFMLHVREKSAQQRTTAAAATATTDAIDEAAADDATGAGSPRPAETGAASGVPLPLLSGGGSGGGGMPPGSNRIHLVSQGDEMGDETVMVDPQLPPPPTEFLPQDQDQETSHSSVTGKDPGDELTVFVDKSECSKPSTPVASPRPGKSSNKYKIVPSG